MTEPLVEKLCKTEGCSIPVLAASPKVEYCCVNCKRGIPEHGRSCFSMRSMRVANAVRVDSAVCAREGCSFPRHTGLAHGYCCNVCQKGGNGHASSCTGRHHATRDVGASFHGFEEQVPILGKADAGGKLGGHGWKKGDGACATGVDEDVSIVWRLCRPSAVDSLQRRFPVVVFFHGSGERGHNNYAQISSANRMLHGLPEPCYMIAVQCPLQRRWVEVHWSQKNHTLPDEPAVALKASMDALDQVLENEAAADPSRVYLLGLSMGGFAVWDALTRWPERFAAAVSISGGADNQAVQACSHLPPVWAFHGAKDTVVRPERSAGAIDALRKSGVAEENARCTIFEEQTHGVWNHVLSDASVGLWLCSHRRLQPEATIER